MSKPKLRFPEFKDLWNNYKIEDMFDRVGTPVDLDDAQTYREIGIRSHGKGIFHKEETTASEIGNKRVFWVEPNCFVVNIVFAWERAVAKTTEDENGMIASHRFPMYKPKKDVVDLDYITEYFITKRGQNVLMLASPGGAGRNKTLGQNEFAKSVVKLPSIPEQQKIADFLSTIDTVIEKQKATVEVWEERKKGVMQKLFSQEVRFKADDGSEFPDWEEKKLGDDVQFINGRAYKQDELLNSGKYLVLRVGNLFTNDSYYYSDLELDNDKYIENGDLIYAWSATFGPRIYYGEKCIYHYHIWKLKFDENIISKIFLNYYLLYDVEKIKSQRTGGTMVHITKNAMEHRELQFPCLAEQQKIADCLSTLDDVIEKQKATLAAWEELKKGLLQQMFV